MIRPVASMARVGNVPLPTSSPTHPTHRHQRHPLLHPLQCFQLRHNLLPEDRYLQRHPDRYQQPPLLRVMVLLTMLHPNQYPNLLPSAVASTLTTLQLVSTVHVGGSVSRMETLLSRNRLQLQPQTQLNPPRHHHPNRNPLHLLPRKQPNAFTRMIRPHANTANVLQHGKKARHSS